MYHAAPLVPLFLVWIAGLWIGEQSLISWLTWLQCSLLVLAFGWWYQSDGRPDTRWLYHPPVYIILLLVTFCWGAARAAVARPDFSTTDLATYNDQGMVTLQATIVRYPEVQGRLTRYELVADTIDIPEKDVHLQSVTGRFLVTLPTHPAYHYGDQLRLSGELITPPVLEDFDYRAFLAHKRIYSLLRQGRAEHLKEGQGVWLLHILFAFRQYGEQTIQRLLPEPHASLMNGILLGIESGIPDDVMEAFNATGTTHIIVISGSNFAILAAIFLLLGHRLLGVKWGTAFAITAIALYALLVGGDPPVLRAAIMGVFSVLALFWRKRTMALNTLALTLVIMTAVQPGQLYDVGFQLSALATLGLILFVDPLTGVTERFLTRYLGFSASQSHRWLPLLSDALLMTCAAQFITTPLIVGTFGRFSVVSLLTNLLILPVQGWLLTSGALATLAGMAWFPLGRLLAFVPFAALEWTLIMVRWTATFPYASVQIGPFPTWTIWVTYGSGGLLWWLRSQSLADIFPSLSTDGTTSFSLRYNKVIWGTVCLFAVIPWWAVAQQPDGRLHIYMLDIGQGDAILIVSPDGKQTLIDGGPDPVPLLSELSAHLPPWDRKIELVILSHADADHIGGLPELLSRYEVESVIDSGYSHTTALYQAWETELGSQELQPEPALPGQQLQLGNGVLLDVLAPQGEPFEGLNDNAVVVRLLYGQFCALLTGDIEAAAETRLIESGTLTSCQVLKVAHHGSQTSSTQPFLDQVRPLYALISAGRDNRFGHPTAEVLERFEAMGTHLFRTDQQGTIHLSTDGNQVWISTEH